MKQRNVGHELVQDGVLLMGIVNVTPDSFSDGGVFLGPDAAIDHARKLAIEGADIYRYWRRIHPPWCRTGIHR